MHDKMLLSHFHDGKLMALSLFDLYPGQHGGGQIFKTLQGLIQTLETGKISMAVLVAEEESCASRHLRQCAMDQNIHVTVSY